MVIYMISTGRQFTIKDNDIFDIALDLRLIQNFRFSKSEKSTYIFDLLHTKEVCIGPFVAEFGKGVYCKILSIFKGFKMQ